LICFWSKTR